MGLHDDILKHQHRVDQRANQLADEMIEALEAVQDKLIEKLSVVQAKLKGDWTNESLKRRKKLLDMQQAEVQTILADLYQKNASDMLQDAAQDVMRGTAEFTVSSMNDVTGLSVKLGHGITKASVVAWVDSSTVDGLLINDWLGKLEASARDRIVGIGRQAMIEGLDPSSMARMLKTQGIEGSVPGLRGLARTFMLSASHHARETTTQELFGDVIKGWRRSVILDGRTCLRCSPYDQKVYQVGESRPVLPAHWNCRCLYLPEVKSWRELGIDADEAKPGTKPAVKHESRWVNHRDGSRSRKFSVADVERVPANTTYETWLKGQIKTDPQFVRSVLGKSRFELFKAGKLSLQRMATHGRIKSLAEIE